MQLLSALVGKQLPSWICSESVWNGMIGDYKMKKYDLFGYAVEVDKQATKEWYGKFKGWKCDCEHCKNFLLLAKKKQLPVIFLDTLKEFEIPPEKPTYVCEITSKKGQLLYQFSYRMTGNILQEKADTQEELEWGEARCCHEIYPYGAPDFPTPHFDLEFWVQLPWILKYTYKDIGDYLRHGREIEFSYKGRECAITNHSKRWWFYDGVEQIEICEFENFTLLVNKIAECMVKDKTVQEIFDNGLYEDVCIL